MKIFTALLCSFVLLSNHAFGMYGDLDKQPFDSDAAALKFLRTKLASDDVATKDIEIDSVSGMGLSALLWAIRDHFFYDTATELVNRGARVDFIGKYEPDIPIVTLFSVINGYERDSEGWSEEHRQSEKNKQAKRIELAKLMLSKFKTKEVLDALLKKQIPDQGTIGEALTGQAGVTWTRFKTEWERTLGPARPAVSPRVEAPTGEALVAALERGAYEEAKGLVQRGADVTYKSRNGKTPLKLLLVDLKERYSLAQRQELGGLMLNKFAKKEELEAYLSGCLSSGSVPRGVIVEYLPPTDTIGDWLETSREWLQLRAAWETRLGLTPSSGTGILNTAQILLGLDAHRHHGLEKSSELKDIEAQRLLQKVREGMADVNSEAGGESALVLALKHGWYEIAKELIRKGADGAPDGEIPGAVPLVLLFIKTECMDCPEEQRRELGTLMLNKFKSTAALELYLRNIYHASSTIGEKLEASREWRQLRVAWEDGMRKKGVSGHEKLGALKTSLGTLQQKLQDLSTKLGQLKGVVATKRL